MASNYEQQWISTRLITVFFGRWYIFSEVIFIIQEVPFSFLLFFSFSSLSLSHYSLPPVPVYRSRSLHSKTSPYTPIIHTYHSNEMNNLKTFKRNSENNTCMLKILHLWILNLSTRALFQYYLEMFTFKSITITVKLSIFYW